MLRNFSRGHSCTNFRFHDFKRCWNPGNFERISSKIATPRICDLWMINPKFPQGKAKTVCRGEVSSKYFPSCLEICLYIPVIGVCPSSVECKLPRTCQNETTTKKSNSKRYLASQTQPFLLKIGMSGISQPTGSSQTRNNQQNLAQEEVNEWYLLVSLLLP